MSLKLDIVEYKPCIKCKVGLVKLSVDYCRNCKYKLTFIKPIKNDRYKIYTPKFDNKSHKNIKSYLNEYSSYETEKAIEFKWDKIQNSLTFLDTMDNQKIPGLSFCLKFNSINDLSGFILKSGKVDFSYLLLVGATKLQNAQKIQKLMENQGSELESCRMAESNNPSPPYTSPLHLLTKSSFWDNLLMVYFQSLHETFPIVSITYFDPKTAPQSLLAAMYYYGYKFQPDQPEKLTSYMDSYAKVNLKSLTRECTLSAIQALLIFYSVFYFDGNIPLHITCRAHATRIAYALGLHLDNKIFSEFENYTRRLVICRVRFINVTTASYRNLYPSYLTEYGILGANPFDQKWQTLNNSTVIHYEDENENLVYTICCTHFIKYLDEYQYNIYNSSLSNVKDTRFKSEWNRSKKAMSNLCEKYLRIFQSLYSHYPLYMRKIATLEAQVNIRHHNFMMYLYTTLKRKVGELSSSDIHEALNHCDCLLKPALLSNNFTFITQYLIFSVGYHYLNLYQSCNLSDKQMIRARLDSIIQIISANFIPSASLSFLILKNGYKSMVINNN